MPRVALRSLKDFALPFNVTLNNQTELFWQFYLISEDERNQLVQQILHKDNPPITTTPTPSNIPLEEPVKSLEPITTLPEQLHDHPLLEKKQFKEKPHKKRTPITDTFIEDIEDHFKKLKIIIEQKETIRKNAELNLIVKVTSSIGQMKYYCKAKNKQRCDEKDLSSAYMEAQIKKLPLLFLYTNEIHKKAQEMLESGAFENAIIKKIE